MKGKHLGQDAVLKAACLDQASGRPAVSRSATIHPVT